MTALALITACGGEGQAGRQSSASVESVERSSQELTQEPPVAAELIHLGQLTLSANVEDVIDPPYDKKPTEQSELLRKLSLEAQALEAADPARFYTMRIDAKTGDVLAVARSKAEAAAHADRIAPGGRALSFDETSDGFIQKSAALSGGVDNRVSVASTIFDTGWIEPTGYLIIGPPGGQGQCTATLFAPWTVITAAHCAVWPAGPGNLDKYFYPRQRSLTNRPFGGGITQSYDFPTAYTAHNCNVSYAYPTCIYYDMLIVTYGRTSGPFTSPGYDGYDWLGDTDFQNTYDQTAGYPACFQGVCFGGGPIADFGCGNTHPQLSGGSTSNGWPYNDGTHPMMRTGCDFDEGQSGSGLFAQSTGHILGVLDFLDCDTNCVHSSDGNRINRNVFNWMSSYR